MSETITGSGRNITILTRDRFGNPMVGSQIEIFVQGRFAGTILTGLGGRGTISLGSLTGSVRVRATGGSLPPQQVDVPPLSDQVEIDLGTAPLVKAKIPPIATCPDGTTGSPCVTCHDGSETWRICA
jgi:hypothetical protein